MYVPLQVEQWLPAEEKNKIQRMCHYYKRNGKENGEEEKNDQETPT